MSAGTPADHFHQDRLRITMQHLRMKQLLLAGLILLSPIVQAQDDDDFFIFDDEEETTSPEISDPLEGFNRAMFRMNDVLYRGLLKPVARGLRILPVPVRNGARNFFSNLGTPISAGSALLQGDLPNTASEAGRFVINSTLGILGIFDPATNMGLEQDDEDLGQTLARYGIGHGFYLVMPFAGSSSLRDFIGNIATNRLNPVYEELDGGQLVALNIIRGEIALSLDQDTYEGFYESALDPYVFFRSAWLQNRAGKVAR